jgi:hypothetical protein
MRQLAVFCREHLGLTNEQMNALAAMLDDAGYVIMPIEATAPLLDAATMAMRHIGTLAGTKEGAQRLKHAARYRAMVEAQRALLGFTPRGNGPYAAVVRAVAAQGEDMHLKRVRQMPASFRPAQEHPKP